MQTRKNGFYCLNIFLVANPSLYNGRAACLCCSTRCVLKKLIFSNCVCITFCIVYVPVNSNTAHCPPHPGHLTGVLLRTVENLTQNEAHQVGHLTVVSKRWSASQAKGSRNSFIPHVHCIHESLLLYSLLCWSI